MTTPSSPIATPATGPQVNLPGSIATPSLSPVYVDGIPLGLVTPPSVSPGPGDPAQQQFWSSEARVLGDPTQECIVISLSSAQLINYITFDLPHFPHQFLLWWLTKGGEWELINGPNGNYLQYFITGSVPTLVNNPAALAAGLNPYHYGAGHWIHFDEQIQPVTTTKLMLEGSRGMFGTGLAAGTYPVDAAGKAAPYPLGLANLDFGYRVRSQSDVPWAGRSPTITTQRESFTTGYDVNGSPVTLSLRENRASDLLLGLPWKCAPQARSDAVVNLYVDARDTSGNPQVIDRFYLQPVTSGCNVTLYYSAAPPPSDAGFQALDTPLVFPAVQPAGQVLPVADSEGLLFSAQPGWIDVSTQGTGENSSQPWWAGIEIMPQFSAADPGSYMIVDGAVFQVTWQAGSWVILISGGVIAQWPASFGQNDRIQFVVGFDGVQGFAWNPAAGLAVTAVTGLPGAAAIRFGAAQGADLSQQDIWPGNYRLTSFILKQETPDISGGIPASFTDFAAGASAYAAPATGPGETTVNAVARFDESFILGTVTSGLNPYGFVGGLGSSYSLCSWTPVLGDFKLAAGYAQFDPVLACVFNFEFTSLQPQTYQFYEGTPQQVQMFQVPVTQPMQPENDAVLDTGLEITQSLAPTITYADAPQPQNAPAASAALPTEALYATDASAAEDLIRQGGSLYNFQQWLPQQPTAIPSSPSAGVHAYQQVDVTQHNAMAYFVSLSAIGMYRANYTAAADTGEYTETFQDTQNISPGSLGPAPPGVPAVPWQWQPGLISVPQGLVTGNYAQMTSVIFNSAHSVRGVQFATTQSPPAQLITDPDFSAMTNGAPDWWGAVGDAVPLQETIAVNAALGNMVTVTRLPTENTWQALQDGFATWGALTAAESTWLQAEGPAEGSAYGGVAYTGAPVAVSGAGRVYAAARVFATQPLAGPLFLQLVDGETGMVLAEAEQPVSGGTVTEWWVGYIIGAGGAQSTLDWAEVTGSYPTWQSTLGEDWASLDISVAPLGATIFPRVIQQGITSDTWYTDNISVFEDSIVWEFSIDGGASWWPGYDVRNNPDGALLFPPAAQGAGTQLCWRVQGWRPNLTVGSLAIRPWYGVHPAGVRPRPAGIGHGPNVNPLIYYPDIHQDPRWQMWDLPIPQDWFFAYQQLLLSHTTYQSPAAPATTPPDTVVGDAIVAIPAAPPPPLENPETFSDIYPDEYTYWYGVIDGSDIYTDNFGNDVYYSNEGSGGSGGGGGTGSASASAFTVGSGAGSITAVTSTPPPVSGSPGLVGGTVHPTTYGLSTSQSVQAANILDGYVGAPIGLGVQRIYQGANWSVQQQIAPLFEQGCKIQVCVKPSQTLSTAEQGNLRAYLQAIIALGGVIDVTLWTECNLGSPFFPSTSAWASYWSYYAPVIQDLGVPLCFNPGADAGKYQVGVEYFQALDPLPDKFYVDFYCSGYYFQQEYLDAPTGGSTLSYMECADSIQAPFGVAEMGLTATPQAQVATASQWNQYMTYIINLFKARLADGKDNADLIPFCTYLPGDSTNNEITASTDFKTGSVAGVNGYYQLYSELSSAVIG
jgi:hypothetical protein